jgi:hypothetical protein
MQIYPPQNYNIGQFYNNRMYLSNQSGSFVFVKRKSDQLANENRATGVESHTDGG